jgi:hypothetical protein
MQDHAFRSSVDVPYFITPCQGTATIKVSHYRERSSQQYSISGSVLPTIAKYLSLLNIFKEISPHVNTSRELT